MSREIRYADEPVPQVAPCLVIVRGGKPYNRPVPWTEGVYREHRYNAPKGNRRQRAIDAGLIERRKK